MSSLVLRGTSTVNPYPPVLKHEVSMPSPEYGRNQCNLKVCSLFAKQSSAESYLNYLNRRGRLEDAVTVLDSIDHSKPKLSPKTFINLLESCIECESLSLGRRIHSRIDLVEERTLPLETKLVGMYAKCGALTDARKVFDEMGKRDLYAWSAMIGGFSRERKWSKVINMFYLMIDDNVLPDAFLFPKILKACGYMRDFPTGEIIHSLVIKCGFGVFPYVENAILSVYAKCEEFDMARKLFNSMENKDSVSWNGMISGYCRVGDIDEARGLIEKMYEQGFEPSSRTWNILISGLYQKGHCDSALQMLKTMETYGANPDVVTWTCMLSGLVQNNKSKEALDLFNEIMCAGVCPSCITIGCALSACTSLDVLDKGVQLHGIAIKMGFAGDLLVGNALIDLYSKCGDLEIARRVFDSVVAKDVYTWNTMIGGYCKAGFCGQAVLLFEQMKEGDVQPNAVTWNTLIFGFLENKDDDQAVFWFDKMGKDANVEWDTATWNSLVAGYSHIGEKFMALNIFRKMQFMGFKPNIVTILSVLPACGNLVALNKVKEIHGVVLRSKLGTSHSLSNLLIDSYGKGGNMVYARTLFDRIPKDFITFHSLITGYVIHGCPDEALQLYSQMKVLGLKPTAGTQAALIIACGFSRLVEEGEKIFSGMREDYQLTPLQEHYAAMVQLYGRSDRLNDAVSLIADMATKPNASVWSSLLTASTFHGNTELAIRAAECLTELEPFPDVIGQSRIEVKNVLYSFLCGDQSSSSCIEWIDKIRREMKKLAEDEECEAKFHSEKLAMAFAFISSDSSPRSIRIMKNFRVCKDCHEMAKFVSKRYGCEIFITDSKSFHHFKFGHCSCRDYW